MTVIMTQEPPTAIYVTDKNMVDYRLISMSVDGCSVTIQTEAGRRVLRADDIIGWKFETDAPIVITTKKEESDAR